jgi:hypothetical protein
MAERPIGPMEAKGREPMNANDLKMILIGGYVTGAILTFLFVGFFCVLGGREEDLWRPFVYGALWPIALPLFLAGKMG